MQPITDEKMQQMLATIKPYQLVLLKSAPGFQKEGAEKIIWEHGRRNFGLRAEGMLNIVAPVTTESDVAGIYIFDADAATVHSIMTDDPGVKEGLFTFEVLPIMSFPGDKLS